MVSKKGDKSAGSYELFEIFMDNFPGLAHMKDQNHKMIYLNNEFEKIFKIDKKIWLGKTVRDVFPEETANKLWENDKLVLEDKKVLEIEEFVEIDNEIHTYLTKKFPITADDGSTILGGISIDITEQKMMQGKMIQLAKLASVGELAAGVGHEINNPLTILDGEMRKLRKFLIPHGIDKLETFQKIQESHSNGIKRISNIVKNLKLYARPSTKENAIDLDIVIDHTIEMFRKMYVSIGIEIIAEKNVKESFIAGFEGQLEQVLLNMVNNARHALSDKENALIKLSTLETSKYIELRVQDNGTGVSDEIKDKLFDSFFTNKPFGEGTGLGLSVSKSIVDAMGGKISVSSVFGEGTTFTMKFPKFKDQIYGKKREVATTLAPLSGSILVIEGDRAIRSIMMDLLQQFGLHVQGMANGLDALKLLDHESFDHILTSEKLPDLEGAEFVQKCRQQFRKSPNFIILVDKISEFENIDKNVKILEKPFFEEDLYSILLKVLS
ncbi:ATP-binding protein [Bacteriovoracaceae bacterium]|nr:ATP-binding protein [Bacteriovoracaceae bacterium]